MGPPKKKKKLRNWVDEFIPYYIEIVGVSTRSHIWGSPNDHRGCPSNNDKVYTTEGLPDGTTWSTTILHKSALFPKRRGQTVQIQQMSHVGKS